MATMTRPVPLQAAGRGTRNNVHGCASTLYPPVLDGVGPARSPAARVRVAVCSPQVCSGQLSSSP
eukprot:4460784-Alexandrium_andersonii.AAC.1